MDKLIKVENYCELTRTSLKFKRDVTRDEWKQVFDSLHYVKGCIQFWIGDCVSYSEQKWGMYDDVAENTGLDKETIRKYKQVSENVKSETRVSNLDWSHHREVASLEPEQQKEFLDKAEKEGLSVRQLKAEVKKSKYKEVELPTDKFRILYADPPWKYNDPQDTEMLGGATKHYPTMTIEQLCDMKINDIVTDDAVLFLWTTSPMLEESFQVVNAWGFTYKTSFVWDKVKHNMGHYNSVRHEILLVCTKGSCLPDVKKLYDSVQTIEKTKKHSEKPEEFRNIIDTIYTTGNKIELFARSKSDGWEVFGNEV